MDRPQSDVLTATPFEIKGSMLTLLELRLHSTGLDAIAQHLAEKVAKAPGMFRSAPIVVDLQALGQVDGLDLAGLAAVMRGHGLVPVGVRGGSPALQAAAVEAGLGLLTAERRSETRPVPAKAAAAGGKTRVVTQPVRSGQQIYADGGDLVVLAAVSPGAEVLADGNIHVYGPLRGRALAGAHGDRTARIFCQCLEAELVSIAGHYRLFEELDPALRGHAAQVFEDGDNLMLQPL